MLLPDVITYANFLVVLVRNHTLQAFHLCHDSEVLNTGYFIGRRTSGYRLYIYEVYEPLVGGERRLRRIGFIAFTLHARLEYLLKAWSIMDILV
jgi:hypothetical protein